MAINFEKKYNLKSLLFDRATKGETNEDKQKQNKNISDILTKLGKNDITLTLSMIGEINMEQNLQYNLLTEQYSLKDKFSSLVERNKTSYSKKITGSISLEGDISRKFFEFSPLETKVTANLKLEMACEAVLITEYGYDKKNKKGLFMEQKLKFSGLKGTFKSDFNADSDVLGKYEYSANNGKPLDFILLEGKTYNLNTIYFFNNKS